MGGNNCQTRGTCHPLNSSTGVKTNTQVFDPNALYYVHFKTLPITNKEKCNYNRSTDAYYSFDKFIASQPRGPKKVTESNILSWAKILAYNFTPPEEIIAFINDPILFTGNDRIRKKYSDFLHSKIDMLEEWVLDAWRIWVETGESIKPKNADLVLPDETDKISKIQQNKAYWKTLNRLNEIQGGPETNGFALPNRVFYEKTDKPRKVIYVATDAGYMVYFEYSGYVYKQTNKIFMQQAGVRSTAITKTYEKTKHIPVLYKKAVLFGLDFIPIERLVVGAVKIGTKIYKIIRNSQRVRTATKAAIRASSIGMKYINRAVQPIIKKARERYVKAVKKDLLDKIQKEKKRIGDLLSDASKSASKIKEEAKHSPIGGSSVRRNQSKIVQRRNILKERYNFLGKLEKTIKKTKPGNKDLRLISEQARITEIGFESLAAKNFKALDGAKVFKEGDSIKQLMQHFRPNDKAKWRTVINGEEQYISKEIAKDIWSSVNTKVRKFTDGAWKHSGPVKQWNQTRRHQYAESFGFELPNKIWNNKEFVIEMHINLPIAASKEVFENVQKDLIRRMKNEFKNFPENIKIIVYNGL